MKNLRPTFLSALLGVVLLACSESTPGEGRNGDALDTTGVQNAEPAAQQAVYACPMHPEVTGNRGDTCPKCGMDLEKVE